MRNARRGAGGVRAPPRLARVPAPNDVFVEIQAFGHGVPASGASKSDALPCGRCEDKNHAAVPGRVESRHPATLEATYLLLPLSFGGASRAGPWSRFQSPPRQTRRAVFRHRAFLRTSHPGSMGSESCDRIMLGSRSLQSTRRNRSIRCGFHKRTPCGVRWRSKAARISAKRSASRFRSLWVTSIKRAAKLSQSG